MSEYKSNIRNKFDEGVLETNAKAYTDFFHCILEAKKIQGRYYSLILKPLTEYAAENYLSGTATKNYIKKFFSWIIQKIMKLLISMPLFHGSYCFENPMFGLVQQ